MRVLIFGKSGQVARELGASFWPAVYSIVQLERAQCDLLDETAVRRVVREIQPDIVVNAAAYTTVDRAESEPVPALATNRDAPAAMAQTCREVGSVLVHLSTDYVFDGKKDGAYVESDPVCPLSVYGRSKAEGEAEICGALREHVILRTSWIFSSHGSNFVKTILRLASDTRPLRIVADQTGGPTGARDIASAIVTISEAIRKGNAQWGTFHYAGSEPTTWHGFAQAVLSQSREFRDRKIEPITTQEYGAPAPRPANSVLGCSRIKMVYGIERPSWRSALANTLAELGL